MNCIEVVNGGDGIKPKGPFSTAEWMCDRGGGGKDNIKYLFCWDKKKNKTQCQLCQTLAWPFFPHSWSGLVWKRVLLVDASVMEHSRTIFLCIWPFSPWWQPNEKMPKRKEGRKRRFPYFIPSRPSKSFVFGEGEVIQDLDLHFTDHHRNTIIFMRGWWKDEVGRGGKKNITPSRCVWWNIFASSPGELLKTWLVKLGFSACYLCFFAQGQYFILSWETHTH